MLHRNPLSAFSALLLALTFASSAMTQDVNLTPKRVVFDERARGSAEVVVFNRGDAPATFRVELGDRAMQTDGTLVELAEPSPASATSFVRYSPRRVTLGPGESQVVRIQARRPANLPAGEYRTHLTVSAIPQAGADAPALAVGEASGGDAIQIRLIPVVGMSIPVIVRQGPRDVQVDLQDLRATGADGGAALAFDITRSGAHSAYGDLELQLIGRGSEQTIAFVRGVGVYPEIDRRTVVLPLRAGAPQLVSGMRLRLTYREDGPGGAILAREEIVLP